MRWQIRPWTAGLGEMVVERLWQAAMLGSAADAEDVVQESWLRWAGVDRSQVRDPRSYLVRIVTRRALNRMRAAGCDRAFPGGAAHRAVAGADGDLGAGRDQRTYLRFLEALDIREESVRYAMFSCPA